MQGGDQPDTVAQREEDLPRLPSPGLIPLDPTEDDRSPLPDSHLAPATLLARRGTLLKATADLTAVVASLFLGLALLSVLSTAPANGLDRFGHNLAEDWLIPLGIMVALSAAGFYRASRRSVQPNTLSELKDLAFAVGAGGVLALALSVIVHGAARTAELHSGQVIAIVLVAIALVAVTRAITRALRHRVATSRVIIVGTGHLAERIQSYLELIKGVQVVGRVPDIPTPDPATNHKSFADLPELCARHRADHVIVAFPTSTTDESLRILRRLQDRVRVSIVPRYYEVVSWRSRIDDLFGLPLLDVAPRHLSRWDRFAKRAVDLCLSILVLIVLSPVLAALCIAIKLSSSGPILFPQIRLGRDRRPFTIYKFRTMHVQPVGEAVPAAEPPSTPGPPNRPLYEVRHKVQEQRRVTPIGAALRKTGFDELPQFVNVLRGDMSLVGPRPFVPHEAATEDAWMERRYEVRPGITGLWQVSGRNSLSTEDLQRLDYLYVASWSLGWDLKIMWETPKVMIRGIGAW